MIWNFVCKKCKKFKSHGSPDYDKKWICCDCRKKLKEVDKKNGNV